MERAESMRDDLNLGEIKSQPVNWSKYLIRLLRRWPYILLFFMASLATGFLYNRYLTPIYSVKGRIITKKFSNKSNSLVPGLVDASFFLNGNIEVFEEIPILKSPERIAAALDRVDFRVSYYSRGNIKTVERIRGLGFDVDLDTLVSGSYPHSTPIFVNHISATEFTLKVDDDEWQKRVAEKKFRFGSPFTLGAATLRIQNTNGLNSEPDKHFFIINRREDLVEKYRNRLSVNWAMKGSTMLDLYMATELPENDVRFMKAYYEVVTEMGLIEKNETLDNTIRFIDTQMALVSDSLRFYQSLVDDMKLDNRNISTGPDAIYSKLDVMDERKAEVLLNNRYLDYITNYFQTKSEDEVFAPSLIGLNIPSLESWVSQFMNLKLTENALLNDDNARNPLVKREDSVRRRLVKGIYEAIKSARERNKEVLNEITSQERILYGSVGQVQSSLRTLERFQRLYDLNYQLFDLLIKRKTEAAISKASATSDYKMIEEPSYSTHPIRPNKEENLMVAGLLGLLLPIGFFLFRDITNSTIMDKDDLQAVLQLPLLGNIAHSDYESRLVVKDHPRSVVVESFRSVRANLKYLPSRSNTGAQVFVITSAVGGEGKSFCSINLAYSLALAKKRVIMIGADLRKPQLANYLKQFPKQGLSHYLAGYAPIPEVILKGEEGGPDFIDAGHIPPDPAELLGSERMEALVHHLKENYDYIIIDTPPIGLVSDAMDLFKYANYNVLIVRQGVTPKAALKMVNDLFMDGKIENFLVLFNDIELMRKRGSYYGSYVYGMGYSGYGYGYYEEDKGGKRNS